MSTGDLTPPTLDDIRALAEAALAEMPAVFRDRLGGLAIRVEEIADDETLDDLGIADPFELTGLYRGVSLIDKSLGDIAGGPDEVILYRRALLDEWADRGDVPLGRLVTHVLVHEIGHHFGLSDDDIAAIDRWWE